MSDVENYIKRDKRYTWHPFTQHMTERDPIVIKSAKGTCLYDVEGNEILDMISSWWTCIHGHANEDINKALRDQAETMEHVMFAGFTHPSAIELSEKLAGILPEDLNRTFFSDNGSTAVEVALKLAFQYWKNKGEDQRKNFLAFEGAYHGDTVGAMSVGKGCGFFNMYEDLLFKVETLPYVPTWESDTDVEQKEKDALAVIEQKMIADKDSIAGLIVEPLMQGAGGIRLCRPEFIKAVTDMARAHDILVIFDEVAVGFGRTGTLFTCQKIGVTPDFICLSKGLTAGYLPMSITVARDCIFDAFLDKGFGKAFLHGHSFTANPLACAIAVRSLELFEENKLLEKVAHIETRHREQIKRLEGHAYAHKIRVKGSIFAFNINSDDGGYKNDDAEFLRDWFLSHGLNIRPLGNAVYLMPPYCITDDELTRAYDGILEGLAALQEKNSVSLKVAV